MNSMNGIIWVACLFAIAALTFQPSGIGLAQGMQVLSGTCVTISDNIYLKIAGGEDFLLKDDNLHAPSFLNHGTLVFTGGGNSKVEQYLDRDTWHIISSPVSDGDISPYLGMYLMEYNEPSESWTYLVEPLSLPMIPGKGYFNWNPPAGEDDPGTPDFVTLEGTLNNNSIPVSLSYSPSVDNPGWNIIGNPYPCALEWNGHPDWNLSGVDAAIYIYEASAGGGSTGNYRVYNFNNPPEAQVPEGNDGMISATQGFWVTATNSGASLTLPETQRFHSNKSFYKNNSEAADNILRLKVENSENEMHCESVIAFSDQSTAFFDSDFDAFFIGSSEAPQLYTALNDTRYMVNYLPSYDENPAVPLGFSSNMETDYQIIASGMESFPPDLPIYLEDKFDGVFHDLKQNPMYTFIGNPLHNPDRFIIHFTNPLGTNDMLLESQIHIYAFQKTIYVDIPDKINGDIILVNLLGEQIARVRAVHGMNTIQTNQENVYLVVTLISDTTIKSQKVFVK